MRSISLVPAIAVFVTGTLVFAQSNNPSGRPSVTPGRLLMLAAWSPSTDQDLVCRITQGERPVDGLSTKTLLVSRSDAKSAESVFQFETPDSPLALVPLGDTNSRLLTVWMGATGYHIRVLAYLHRTVRIVLDTASRAFPEFRLDESARESILVTELKFEGGEWTPAHGTTQVFSWTGSSYERIGRVPWKVRFECVSPQSCATVK